MIHTKTVCVIARVADDELEQTVCIASWLKCEVMCDEPIKLVEHVKDKIDIALGSPGILLDTRAANLRVI